MTEEEAQLQVIRPNAENRDLVGAQLACLNAKENF